mgnify:CR=1 FL=1
MKKMIKFVATVVALTLIGVPSIKVVVRTVLADEPITTVQNTKEAVSLTEATETTTAPTADNTVDVDTSASAEVNQDQTQTTQSTSSDSNVQLDENGKYTPNYKSINSKEELDKMWDEAESNPSQFGGKGRVPEEPTPSEPSKPSEPSEPEPSKPSEPSEPTPSKPEEPKSSSSEEPKSSASSAESKEVKETKKPLPTAGLPVTGEEKIVDYAMMATGFIILLFTMRYTTIVAFIKGKYKI